MKNPPLENLAGEQDKDNENRIIFKALYKQNRPLSRRALYNLTYRSRTIKISYSKPCKTTGKTVYHYFTNDAVEGFKNGF